MMNRSNNSKVLITIIGILLVANIALVAFLLVNKDDDDRHDKPRTDRKTMIANFLKTEIGFDTVQLQQYDTLSSRHKENMKKMFEELRRGKDKQFKELAAAGFSDSVMNSIADRSSEVQRVMELKMFNHLKNVRLLCTAEQIPKFDSLFGNMLSRRNGEGRKKQGDASRHEKKDD